MSLKQELTLSDMEELIQQQADHISQTQLPSGLIPWHQNGIADPWDHVESAIALDASGRSEEAARAYLWLRDHQNPDGSWWSSYIDDKPQDLTRDTNYSTYLAVGLWYHYLHTGNADFIAEMWPTMEEGINFALQLQQPTGEVHWASDAQGAVYPVAVIASSSCVFQSLRAAVRIARLLGLSKPEWSAASRRLARAIGERPDLFQNSVDGQFDYAMSWYYPVLVGIVNGPKARAHILEKWSDFVLDGWGCKCVVEEPWWITVAETCELVLTLNRLGEHDRAALLLDWILGLRDEDGRFWTGMKIPEEEIWPPAQKPSWVSAAMIIGLTSQMEARGARNGLFRRFL